ncbi:6-hydroxymethylpterin diphosphokinase MptE-like protein [Ferroplasma sp.]|uniref:6-hydroxymethylpterin diphosphokinase MptE-like protein n=1 Tax=Ferroplasma sp. TaxID=2591003 RepID=UPI00307F16F9
MNFQSWFPLYLQITDSLGINRNMDYRSSLILKKFMHNEDILLEKYRGRNAFVVGNGPNMKNIGEIISEGYVIVADSAIESYITMYGYPDIIVTDLDGNIDSIVDAYNKGSIVLVHAHGDNIEAIKKYAQIFQHGIATTQNIPMKYLYNYGGFSDGDRSAFLADELGAPVITLLGFDFKNVTIKPYYDDTAISRKRIKLKWAEYLLTCLAASRGRSMFHGNVIEI